jgi:hypothetical protein
MMTDRGCRRIRRDRAEIEVRRSVEQSKDNASGKIASHRIVQIARS